jgi:hypothetical protein
MIESSKDRRIGYITSHCDFDAQLPFEIAPDFVLRRATSKEQSAISKFLLQFTPHKLNPHEYRWTFGPGRTATRIDDQEGWRYHVIEFPADILVERQNQKLILRFSNLFFDAISISEAKLHCDVIGILYPDPEIPVHILSWTPQRMTTLHGHLEHELDCLESIREVRQEQLIEIAPTWALLRALAPEQTLIRMVIARYNETFCLDANSSFRVLAFFATIELLVTHHPKENEAGDGLGRQLRSKLPLLARRFQFPMDADAYFGASKVWDVLYSLRSAVAHGATVDFSQTRKKGGFKELHDFKMVVFFLEEFTRRLILQAVREPQLVLDLKEC